MCARVWCVSTRVSGQKRGEEHHESRLDTLKVAGQVAVAMAMAVLAILTTLTFLNLPHRPYHTHSHVTNPDPTDRLHLNDAARPRWTPHATRTLVGGMEVGVGVDSEVGFGCVGVGVGFGCGCEYGRTHLLHGPQEGDQYPQLEDRADGGARQHGPCAERRSYGALAVGAASGSAPNSSPADWLHGALPANSLALMWYWYV